MTDWLLKILIIAAIQSVLRWLFDLFGITMYLQTWKTDWVTGVGIAFLIVLTPMVLVALWVQGWFN